MTTTMPAPLRELRFRSNPLIDLRQLADLPEDDRETFRELERDPDFYGLFVPKPPLAMNLKAVERQTGRLFESLAVPSRIEETALQDDDLIDLVMDAILEIESEDGFVSGADAFPLVCPRTANDAVRETATARLSREALLHASDLVTSQPRALTFALYHYNRLPISAFWKARFGTADAILEHLGADRGSLRALLETRWTASRTSGWLCWTPKTRVVRGAGGVAYKLYVSARPEHIRDAFEIVVRALAEFQATAFKIGDGPAALLRPDKLVAYFATREELTEAAALLERELAGCEAQGVPFSAGLDDDGLLSWGIDPPDDESAPKWLGRESWRMWVVKRLGNALAVAKAARGNPPIEPWRFALERARRHGIDVDTWTAR